MSACCDVDKQNAVHSEKMTFVPNIRGNYFKQNAYSKNALSTVIIIISLSFSCLFISSIKAIDDDLGK